MEFDNTTALSNAPQMDLSGNRGPPLVDYNSFFVQNYCRMDPRLFSNNTDMLSPCNYEGYIQMLRFFAALQLEYDAYVERTGDTTKNIKIVSNINETKDSEKATEWTICPKNSSKNCIKIRANQIPDRYDPFKPSNMRSMTNMTLLKFHEEKIPKELREMLQLEPGKKPPAKNSRGLEPIQDNLFEGAELETGNEAPTDAAVASRDFMDVSGKYNGVTNVMITIGEGTVRIELREPSTRFGELSPAPPSSSSDSSTHSSSDYTTVEPPSSQGGFGAGSSILLKIKELVPDEEKKTTKVILAKPPHVLRQEQRERKQKKIDDASRAATEKDDTQKNFTDAIKELTRQLAANKKAGARESPKKKKRIAAIEEPLLELEKPTTRTIPAIARTGAEAQDAAMIEALTKTKTAVEGWLEYRHNKRITVDVPKARFYKTLAEQVKNDRQERYSQEDQDDIVAEFDAGMKNLDSNWERWTSDHKRKVDPSDGRANLEQALGLNLEQALSRVRKLFGELFEASEEPYSEKHTSDDMQLKAQQFAADIRDGLPPDIRDGSRRALLSDIPQGWQQLLRFELAYEQSMSRIEGLIQDRSDIHTDIFDVDDDGQEKLLTGRELLTGRGAWRKYGTQEFREELNDISKKFADEGMDEDGPENRLIRQKSDFEEELKTLKRIFQALRLNLGSASFGTVKKITVTEYDTEDEDDVDQWSFEVLFMQTPPGDYHMSSFLLQKHKNIFNINEGVLKHIRTTLKPSGPLSDTSIFTLKMDPHGCKEMSALDMFREFEEVTKGAPGDYATRHHAMLPAFGEEQVGEKLTLGDEGLITWKGNKVSVSALDLNPEPLTPGKYVVTSVVPYLHGALTAISTSGTTISFKNPSSSRLYARHGTTEDQEKKHNCSRMRIVDQKLSTHNSWARLPRPPNNRYASRWTDEKGIFFVDPIRNGQGAMRLKASTDPDGVTTIDRLSADGRFHPFIYFKKVSAASGGDMVFEGEAHGPDGATVSVWGVISWGPLLHSVHEDILHTRHFTAKATGINQTADEYWDAQLYFELIDDTAGNLPEDKVIATATLYRAFQVFSQETQRDAEVYWPYSLHWALLSTAAFQDTLPEDEKAQLLTILGQYNTTYFDPRYGEGNLTQDKMPIKQLVIADFKKDYDSGQLRRSQRTQPVMKRLTPQPGPHPHPGTSARGTLEAQNYANTAFDFKKVSETKEGVYVAKDLQDFFSGPPTLQQEAGKKLVLSFRRDVRADLDSEFTEVGQDHSKDILNRIRTRILGAFREDPDNQHLTNFAAIGEGLKDLSEFYKDRYKQNDDFIGTKTQRHLTKRNETLAHITKYFLQTLDRMKKLSKDLKSPTSNEPNTEKQGKGPEYKRKYEQYKGNLSQIFKETATETKMTWGEWIETYRIPYTTPEHKKKFAEQLKLAKTDEGLVPLDKMTPLLEYLEKIAYLQAFDKRELITFLEWSKNHIERSADVSGSEIRSQLQKLARPLRELVHALMVDSTSPGGFGGRRDRHVELKDRVAQLYNTRQKRLRQIKSLTRSLTKR